MSERSKQKTVSGAVGALLRAVVDVFRAYGEAVPERLQTLWVTRPWPHNAESAKVAVLVRGGLKEYRRLVKLAEERRRK